MNTTKQISTEGKVTFEQTEDDDLWYWASMSVRERLESVFEWNKKIWHQIRGQYPVKRELAGGKFYKSETDEDDF